MTEYFTWITAVMILACTAVWLTACLHYKAYGTVRIYNWNGRRYCYVGRSRIHKKNDTYVTNIRERQADVSRTTRFRFCLGRGFVKKHRFQSLLVRAGSSIVWIPIEENMEGMIYFRGQ